MQAKAEAIFVLVILRLCFDVAYIYLLVPTYGSAGFTSDFDIWRALVSAPAVGAFGLLVWPANMSRPSDYIFMMLVATILVPASTLYAAGGFSGAYFWALYIAMFGIWSVSRLPRLRVPPLREGLTIWLLAAALAFIILEGMFAFRGGWHIFNLDFDRIYQVREVAQQEITTGLVGYLSVWTTKVFGVFFVLYFAYTKRIIFSIASLLLVWTIFAMTGHKSIFFFPLAALAVMFLYLRGFSPVVIGLGALAVVVGTSLIVVLFGYDRPFAWFFMRTFMLTALNHFDYYNFAAENGWTMYSNSFLAGYVDYPFSEKVPELIGKGRWQGNGDAFANTGVLATGYMHLGYLGMALHALGVGLVLWLGDSLTRTRQLAPVGFALLFMSAFQFRSIDFPTAMLSGGTGLVLVGLWLFGSTRIERRS